MPVNKYYKKHPYRKEVVCENCGKKFVAETSTAKWCKKCREGRKKEIMVKICKNCGKEFKTTLSRQAFCCTKCRKEKRPSGEEWASLVEFVTERDNFKCVKCGSNKKLNVHHIKFLSRGGNNKVDNLVTLCEQCHIKVHKVS